MDSQNKLTTSATAIYDIIKGHFHAHLYDENMPSIEPFIGRPTNLDKPITGAEVQQAAKKLNNNCAAGINAISAELVTSARSNSTIPSATF
jgi:hypothetical protein